MVLSPAFTVQILPDASIAMPMGLEPTETVLVIRGWDAVEYGVLESVVTTPTVDVVIFDGTVATMDWSDHDEIAAERPPTVTVAL